MGLVRGSGRLPFRWAVGAGDAALEIRQAMEVGPDFKRTFKKNLEIL